MTASFRSRAIVVASRIRPVHRRTRHQTGILVAVLVVGSLISACGNDARTTTSTSATTITGPPTTVAADGLDCLNEQRAMTIVEPPEGFTGYATPEEAARRAAQAPVLPQGGTVENVGGADWIIRTADGRAVGRTEVGPWGQGWFAGEITTCDDGQHDT